MTTRTPKNYHDDSMEILQRLKEDHDVEFHEEFLRFLRMRSFELAECADLDEPLSRWAITRDLNIVFFVLWQLWDRIYIKEQRSNEQ